MKESLYVDCVYFLLVGMKDEGKVVSKQIYLPAMEGGMRSSLALAPFTIQALIPGKPGVPS